MKATGIVRRIDDLGFCNGGGMKSERFFFGLL